MVPALHDPVPCTYAGQLQMAVACCCDVAVSHWVDIVSEPGVLILLAPWDGLSLER